MHRPGSSSPKRLRHVAGAEHAAAKRRAAAPPSLGGVLEVLLAHPGGPFWRNKHAGAWQIPKGEMAADEDPESAARREFAEELGVEVPGPLLPLGEIRQAGGKHVVVFTAEHDIDPDGVMSNRTEIEWPPRSGRRIEIPEIDAARWLSLSEARRLMLPSQLPFLNRLEELGLEPGRGVDA